MGCLNCITRPGVITDKKFFLSLQKIMKRLQSVICGILLLALGATAFKADAVIPPPPGSPFRYVTLRLTNGSYLDAGRMGSMTLTADSLLRFGNGEKMIQVPLSQVAGWDLRLEENITVSAESIGNDSAPVFRITPAGVVVNGLKRSDILTLTRIDGAMNTLPHNAGEVLVSTEGLAKGVYVITAGGKSLKFLVP